MNDPRRIVVVVAESDGYALLSTSERGRVVVAAETVVQRVVDDEVRKILDERVGGGDHA